MSDYKTIVKRIKSRQFAPIYFFYGEEPFYIDKLTKLLDNTVLNDSEKAFNQTVVYGKDTEAINVAETAGRLPMMSEYQVVIVKEAQDLKGLTDLEPYFNKPNPSTVLVLAYKAKPDKRKSLFKTLNKNKQVTAFESVPVRDYEVTRWIENYIAGEGIKMEPKGTELLAEFLGTDLSKITNELDKLMVLKTKGEVITTNDIEDNVGISKDFNVFELNTAMGERNITKVFQIVDYFRANPKAMFLPAGIGAIYSFFSRLYLIQANGNAGMQQLKQVTKIFSDFILKKNIAYARNYPTHKLERIFTILSDYDLKAKGVGNGSFAQEELLREMVLKIVMA